MTPLLRFLDTVGDGSGTKNAIGNYSGGATDFSILRGTDDIYITDLIVTIEDATGCTADEYGNTGAALTNGIDINYTRAGTTTDLTDGVPIKTNTQWARLGGEVSIIAGGVNDIVLVWIKFARSLALDNQFAKLAVNCNDDLSGLVSHYFTVRGYIN